MVITTTAEALAKRKRVPRLYFSIAGRIDGTWAEIEAFMRDHVLDLQETLRRVRTERLSLARLGDGELLLAISAEAKIGFQLGSPELQADLQSILKGDGWDDLPLLRCLPGITASYYRPYWAKYWSFVKPLLNLSATYGDTSVSREEMFRIDAEASRQAWRAVWNDKNVCYIVGRKSRFDPIAALFDGVASQRTIYSVPKDAYADIPRIIDEVVASVPRDTLILLALGPAATVLAARLTRLGYWALDIGHITNAYQTVVHGAPRAETTPLVAPD
jgi:hypothetical protein